METEWKDDGTKYTVTMWRDGKKHGIQRAWYPNGSKLTEVTRKEGKSHGVRTLYHEEGTKWREDMWRDGEWYGLTTKWHENGVKTMEYDRSVHMDYSSIKWDEEGNVTEAKFASTLTTKTPPTPIYKTEQRFKPLI